MIWVKFRKDELLCVHKFCREDDRIYTVSTADVKYKVYEGSFAEEVLHKIEFDISNKRSLIDLTKDAIAHFYEEDK